MKISIFGFDNDIVFEENYINILEISDKKLYIKALDSFNNLINKNETETENEIVLIEDEKIMDFHKNAYIVFDIFNIEFNSKEILNNLYEEVSRNIKISEEYEFEKIVLKLRNYLIKEINEVPFEFIMKDSIKIEDVLKIFNLKIDVDNYIKLIDKVFFFIDIISLIGKYRILIIPNLKLYFLEEELIEIYKYSKYKNINLLIIENRIEENQLEYEKKNIIYIDFNDIVKI